MANPNYSREMDALMARLQSEGRRPKLLLHSCCAPCSSYVLEYLCPAFEITVFFFNPNIHPAGEYEKRLAEQRRLVEIMGRQYPDLSLVEGDYDPDGFFTAVKGLEKEPEGGKRCEVCFVQRLAYTADLAKAKGFDYFATTLTVSPHKNAPLINEIGARIGERLGVEYLPSDFKKKGGYQRSTVLSREYGLYRQNYCGCAYSIWDGALEEKGMKIKNPIVKAGSNHSRDPWVVYHEGAYYHCFARDRKVWVSKSDTLENLGDGAAVAVFAPPEGTMYSHELWAPELHLLDGKWYVYVACDDGNNDNHRMYALEGGADAQGEYVFRGKITDPTDKWAIDATILEWEGVRYFVWSGWEGDINTAQNIYIARMDTPLTVDSERVCISRPELDWEKAGGDGVNLPFINEGPAALIHGERVHVIYSGGGSWSNDYCLGRLTLKVGGDPMNAADWEKCDAPVFKRNDAVKGPGHCSFTKTEGENGEMLDVVVYHAYDEDCSKGWESCSARAQVFTWDGDMPAFGEPVALD